MLINPVLWYRRTSFRQRNSLPSCFPGEKLWNSRLLRADSIKRKHSRNNTWTVFSIIGLYVFTKGQVQEYTSYALYQNPCTLYSRANFQVLLRVTGNEIQKENYFMPHSMICCSFCTEWKETIGYKYNCSSLKGGEGNNNSWPSSWLLRGFGKILSRKRGEYCVLDINMSTGEGKASHNIQSTYWSDRHKCTNWVCKVLVVPQVHTMCWPLFIKLGLHSQPIDHPNPGDTWLWNFNLFMRKEEENGIYVLLTIKTLTHKHTGK